VVFSWDGAAEDSNRLFSRFRDVAQANNASMTYFLSGVYTPPESRRMLYQPPRHARGASDIPFLKDSQIAVPMQEVRQAWLEGYEIGTHFNGHFCEPNGGASWTVQDWASELRQAKGLVITGGPTMASCPPRRCRSTSIRRSWVVGRHASKGRRTRSLRRRRPDSAMKQSRIRSDRAVPNRVSTACRSGSWPTGWTGRARPASLHCGTLQVDQHGNRAKLLK